MFIYFLVCGLKGNEKILNGTWEFGDVIPNVEDKEMVAGPQVVHGKYAKTGEWPWLALIDLCMVILCCVFVIFRKLFLPMCIVYTFSWLWIPDGQIVWR